MNNMETIGIPKLSNQKKSLLDCYLKNSPVYFNDWSSDNKAMLVRKRKEDTFQIFYLNQAKGILKQLTHFKEPVTRLRSTKNPKMNGFVYDINIGGNEQNQIYYYDLSNGSSHLITDGTSKNDFSLWNHAGNELVYSSNAINQIDFHIFSTKITADLKIENKLLFKAAGKWYPVCWSLDDRFLIISKFISALQAEPHLLEVATGQLTKLYPSNKKVFFTRLLFSKLNNQLYIVSDEDTDFLKLRLYDILTGEQQLLTEKLNWNIESIALDKTGNHLAFICNENGYYKLYLMDTKTYEYKPLSDIPKGQVTQIKFDETGNFLAMNISSYSNANEVFVYDIKNLKITQWTFINAPSTEEITFAKPSLIHYPSFDNVNGKKRQIPAFCYLPDKQGSFPTLIHIHGGPESQFEPNYHPFFQYLINQLGIAIIAPNVRGSWGYGKKYIALDDGFKREDSVKDIGALLDWIAANPNLNEKQVGVMGGSYGGYMVYAALIHYAKRLTCGISRVGISNFVTFLENTKAYRRDIRREEYGDERIPEMRKFLHEISPTTNAHKISKPMLIVQGGNDPRVPESEAKQMYDSLTNNGIPVWYILAKDEGHGFKKKKNIDYYHKVAISFLKQYLLLQ